MNRFNMPTNNPIDTDCMFKNKKNVNKDYKIKILH